MSNSNSENSGAKDRGQKKLDLDHAGQSREASAKETPPVESAGEAAAEPAAAETPPAPAAKPAKAQAKLAIPTEQRSTEVDAKQNAAEEMPEIIAGRYQVLRVIGRGGMGVVLLAQDTKLGRYVAIKRLVFRSHNMRVVQRRFLREAQTIAALGHVSIVNVFDIGQDEDVGYITMEYITGPVIDESEEPSDPPMPVGLDRYIHKTGAMAPEKAEAFILKLCSAMEYAHKKGTIHRDIKPSNVLLTEAFEPKLVDFGLARPIDISRTDEITLEGTMLGTPEYSAPEQWGDIKAVSVTADVYALGGVFWFMLSGRIPRFFRESDMPPQLSAVIAKAMCQKPADRYQSVNEFATAIRDSRGKSKTVAGKPEAAGKRQTKEGWQCPNCTKFNPDSANYCVHCGASGMRTCLLCGAEIKINIRFCPNCGEDIQLAEESAGILLAAKNHASFLEFETALDMIKELGKRNNTEVRQLAREWREIVLQRRSLLMELESAMRGFDQEKAVAAAAELKGLVPEECLSETADFDVVVAHSELTAGLRNLLVEAATRAHDRHNLGKFSQNIHFLNQVFGEEVCGAVNAQLAHTRQELDQTLTQAGLALGLNCISQALEIIGALPPWQGDELGERRMRLSDDCRKLLEKRERAIEEIEAAIRKEEYGEALGLIRETSRFRLPPDHGEITPAREDLEAHEQIMRNDKFLTQTIDQQLPDWISQDNWKAVYNSLQALREGESRTWRELLDRLKKAVHKEIARRYNHALELERKGHITLAERAWREFQAIPPELAPPHLLEEAAEFSRRKQAYVTHRTHALLKKGIVFLCLLWPYYLWRVCYPAISVEAEVPFRHIVLAIVPIVLFVFFGVALGTKTLARIQKQSQRYVASPRLIVLALLATLSPLSLVCHEPFHEYLYQTGFMPAILHPALVVGAVWLLLDAFRSLRLRRPASFGLTLSWLVASILVFLLHEHSLETGVRVWLWPTVALTQAAVFALIQFLDHLVYSRQYAEESTPTEPGLPAPAGAETPEDAPAITEN